MALERLRRLAQGIGLAKPVAASRWKASVVLDRGFLGEACLALDGQGRGAALWENGGRLWTMPVGVQAKPALVRLPLEEGKAPWMDLNPDGRGLALWQVEKAGERLILGKLLGHGERGSQVLFRTGGQIRHLQAAVDRRGNALMIWLLEKDGQVEVMAQAFDTREQSWEQAPTRLGSPTLATAEPRLAANHREHAMVLWEVSEGNDEGLVASHYWPSDRIWSDRPVPVVSHATRHHQVVMDGSGNALAIWIHAPYGQRRTLEASFYDVIAGEWGEPEVLSSAHSFSIPRLVMSGEGEALAAWCQSEGHGPPHLLTKRFSGGRWHSGLTCFELGHGPVRDFAVDIGPEGMAGLLAVHHGADGDWVSVRLLEQEWSAPVSLVPPSRASCSSPRLSLSPRGVSALWIQGVGREQTLFLAETHA